MSPILSLTFRRNRSQSILHGFSAFCAGLALCALTATTASAQALYSTGFEPTPASPAWTDGVVRGQNSWGALDASNPTGFNSAGYADVAFQVVTSPVSFTGPGGTESIPSYAGTQMVSSSTTYVPSPPATYTNLAYVSLQTAWNARGTDPASGITNNVAESSIEIYIPSVDSSLLGGNGIALYGGALGLTNLGVVDFANSASGALQVTVAPAIGTATVDGSGLFPNVLVRNTWLNLTTYLNYNNGTFTTVVTNGTHSLTVTKTNAFSTTSAFFSQELVNQSNVADTASSYAFEDNYSVTATTPSPNALPIFASGLAAVVPWLRRRNHIRATR